MFSRVKKLVGLRVLGTGMRRRRGPGPFETLEARQYLFAPDMYIPIAGGGCMCPICTGAFNAQNTVPLNSASGVSGQAAEEAAPVITQLVLVNADNGALIGPFENNTTVDYSQLPPNLSVRAYTSGATGSVRFAVDANPNLQTENYDPYYLLGDNAQGLPNVWRPTNGSHTMKVTAFTGAGATGSPGPAMSLTFNVGNAPNTGPTLVSGPTVWFSDTTADAKEAGLDRGTLVVSRTGSTASALQVFYNVAGNASNGADYETLSGSITIPAGQSSVNLVVIPKDDALVEGTEDVSLNLIGGSNYNVGSPAAASCPIADNDSGTVPPTGDMPALSINDASRNEGNSGTASLTFTVTRSGNTAGSSTVNWSTQNQSAGEGDYVVGTGSVSFAPGETSKSINIGIKGDTKVEGNETFLVNLSSPSGASISDGQGQGTIVNDDSGTSTGQNISDITWSSSGVTRSPEPRTEAGSIQIGSKIYAIGGFTATGGTGSFFPLTRKVHVYDMVAKKWTQLASLPSTAAGNHFGVASDGQNIYTVAGQTGNTYGVGTNTVYKYNIASNTWTKFYANLPEVRFGGAAFIENGWLHFVGGDKADRETATTVGSSRVDLQACKLEYSIVSPK